MKLIPENQKIADWYILNQKSKEALALAIQAETARRCAEIAQQLKPADKTIIEELGLKIGVTGPSAETSEALLCGCTKTHTCDFHSVRLFGFGTIGAETVSPMGKQTAQDVVLDAVRLMRLRPTQLIDALRGFSLKEIQEAVVDLNHRGLIILSSDRYLEIPTPLGEKP